MKKLVLPLLAAALVAAQPAPRQQPAAPPTAPPAWAKSAIWYQIFVERFANGDPTNDPGPATMRPEFNPPPGWAVTPWTSDWYRPDPWAQDIKDFNQNLGLRRYGGDLQGVLSKLDYLQDLGITALFLNPVNDAPSLHKYDARSYAHVDVNFGPDPTGDQQLIASENPLDPTTWKWTAADRLLLKLIQEAHRRKMRIILDYSWNHTGTQFFAWQDILKNQQRSAYKDWYAIKAFDDPATPANEFAYEGWAGVSSLPELKKVDVPVPRVSGYPYEGQLNPGAKRHIFDVTRRWLAPDGDVKRGIDGYRLDVADQIPMGFWRDYRALVKSVNPDAYLVGEIWWQKWPTHLMNPAPYCRGDVFDAVMFYQHYRPARAFFAKVNEGIDARQLADSLNLQWNRLAEPFRYSQMLVATSHDAPRLLTCFGNPDKYKFHANGHEDPNYVTGRPDAETYQRARLYLMHQFTLLGGPHIWNGEEMGMWGPDDPECRKPLWWPELTFQAESRPTYQPGPATSTPVAFNREHFAFYRQLCHLRQANPVLATGKLTFLKTEGKQLAYSRTEGKDQIVVLFNLEADARTFQLPPTRGKWRNLLDDKAAVAANPTLAPLSGLILKEVAKK